MWRAALTERASAEVGAACVGRMQQAQMLGGPPPVGRGG